MVRIMADTCSDITFKEAEELGIDLIPLTINFEAESFLDEIEISKDEFYNKLSTCKKLPTTSQPSPDYYEKLFKKATENGDEVLLITISSKLSGTYQCAEMVKSNMELDNVYVYDSTFVAESIKILVLEAIKYRDKLSATEIIKILEALKPRIRIYGLIDTLEFLHRGGRLSRSVALIGALLNIKPVGQIKDGIVQIVGKQRGAHRAAKMMKELVTKDGIDSDYPVFFGYAADKSNCQVLAEMISDDPEKAVAEASNLSPVVGTHIGPKCAFIAFVAKNV